MQVRAIADFITEFNNPVANASPIIAFVAGVWCYLTGLKHTRWDTGRQIGSAVCLTTVGMSAVLRIMLWTGAVSQRTFLQLAAANAPVIFSTMAYLFWARSQANQRLGRERRLIEQIERDHAPYLPPPPS